MAISKFIYPVLSELIAGTLAFVVVSVVYYLLVGDFAKFLTETAIKAIPVSLAIIFFKLITCYYFMLKFYLYISKQQITETSLQLLGAIFVISCMAVLLLICFDAVLNALGGKIPFGKRFSSLFNEFFNFSQPMAKYVYAGILASLISPFFLRLLKNDVIT